MIHLKIFPLILLILAVTLMAGCNKNYTVQDDTMLHGAHVLTDVQNSQGVPMVFEGMMATVFGDVDNPQQVIVFTHGDSGRANYLLDHAQAMAVDTPGLVTVVLARPGCVLEERQSEGRHNPRSQGDHYTEENIAMMENALRVVEEYFHPQELFMFGHSGGAITTALIVGRQPDLLDGAIMVSLVGDIDTWTRYSFNQNTNPAYSSDYRDWRWPNSLSPNDFVENISLETVIVVISGAADTNTPPAMAQSYVDSVKAAGHDDIEFIILPEATHNGAARMTPEMEIVIRGMLSREGTVQ